MKESDKKASIAAFGGLFQDKENPAPDANGILRVAVTGGIGSGKSYLCKRIEAAGHPVFYCDDEAKRIIRTDPEVQADLRRLVGEEVYGAEGRLVKSVLAAYLCRGREYSARVDAIVHPRVARAFAERAKEMEARAVEDFSLKQNKGFGKLGGADVRQTQDSETKAEPAELQTDVSQPVIQSGVAPAQISQSIITSADSKAHVPQTVMTADISQAQQLGTIELSAAAKEKGAPSSSLFSVFLSRFPRRSDEGNSRPVFAGLEDVLAACPARRVLFMECALLYESGFDCLVHRTLLAHVSAETQVRRVMARDGVSRAAALSWMALQLSEDDRLRRADIVVDNEG